MHLPPKDETPVQPDPEPEQPPAESPKSKPKKGGLKARAKKAAAATKKKKARRRRENKVDKPKPEKPKPYNHLTGEDAIEVPGFGMRKIWRVLSLPGLAYFENHGVMYLLHLKSLKPLPFPIKNDYLVEKVCERFRHVPWNEDLEWFRTPEGKKVREEMEAFIKEIT